MKKIELSLETIKPVLIACTQCTDNKAQTFNVADIPDSELLAASFEYDLSMDSLDFLMFCTELERQLNIRFDLSVMDTDFAPKLTLVQFLDYVNTLSKN
ncbi:MAG: hypothetical protein IKN71_04250 [Alphaproteobacteria bacterium]|jgi:acyl carrier protein|nr:hypothetical protein [Alphaproteobacteria bacterium]